MKIKITQLLTVFLVLGLVTSCSKISLTNPFGTGGTDAASPYANATHYSCLDKKQFYVRMMENNLNAWLIYPDHEVNLKQTPSDKNRYTSGAITLFLNGNETTLTDGEKIAYSTCKPQK
jgi:membrane-bound inhibitor of C-type lysozyme